MKLVWTAIDNVSEKLKLLIDLACALCVKAGAYPKAVSNTIIYTYSFIYIYYNEYTPMVVDVIQDPLVSKRHEECEKPASKHQTPSSCFDSSPCIATPVFFVP